jgi:hypothetical protein
VQEEFFNIPKFGLTDLNRKKLQGVPHERRRERPICF